MQSYLTKRLCVSNSFAYMFKSVAWFGRSKWRHRQADSDLFFTRYLVWNQHSEVRTLNIKTLFINFDRYSNAAIQFDLAIVRKWLAPMSKHECPGIAGISLKCRPTIFIPTILLAYDWSSINVKVSTNQSHEVNTTTFDYMSS